MCRSMQAVGEVLLGVGDNLVLMYCDNYRRSNISAAAQEIEATAKAL